MGLFPNLRIRAKMMLSLVVVLPCLLAMTILLVHYQTVNQQRWHVVRQHTIAIGKSDELLLQLTNLQVSASDYAAFGDESSRTFYREASQRYEQLQREIIALVAQDAVQSARIHDLDRAVAVWRTTVLTPMVKTQPVKPGTAPNRMQPIMVNSAMVGQFNGLKSRVRGLSHSGKHRTRAGHR